MGSAALCGFEPGARGNGGMGGEVEVVERGGALRTRWPRPDVRHGAVAHEIDDSRVASVSGGGGIGHRGKCPAPLHAHRAAAGEFGIYRAVGTDEVATVDSKKRRAAEEINVACSRALLAIA